MVRASKLGVRDDVTPPITAAGRKTQFRSGSYKGLASGVVAPVAGSSGDPTLGGGQLTVYNAASGAETVIPLPPSDWTLSGSVLTEKYRYRSPKGAATNVKITVGAGRLGVQVKGDASFALTGAPQGTLAVRLALGSSVQYCSAAPAKAPSATNDTPSKFVGVPNSPAPASCPPLP